MGAEDDDDDDTDKEAEEGTGIEMLGTELVDNKGGAVLDDDVVVTGNPGVEELGVKAGVDEDVGSPGVLIESEGEADDDAAGAVDDEEAVELGSGLLAGLLMDRGPVITGNSRA